MKNKLLSKQIFSFLFFRILYFYPVAIQPFPDLARVALASQDWPSHIGSKIFKTYYADINLFA